MFRVSKVVPFRTLLALSWNVKHKKSKARLKLFMAEISDEVFQRIFIITQSFSLCIKL